MKQPQISPWTAAGFTLLLAGIVASVILADWAWVLVGGACFLAAAIWASAISGGDDE